MKKMIMMSVMAITILFGYSPQASAQNASSNYLNFDNYESIGTPSNNSGLSNYYQYTEDEQNNIAYLTMSVSGAVHAKQNANNNWITPNNGSNIIRSWNPSQPFLGGGEYFTGDQSVYGTVSYASNWLDRDYSTATVTFRMTNINEVKLLGKNETRASWNLGFSNEDPRSSLQVYEYNNNSFSGDGTRIGDVSTEASEGSVDLSVGGLNETSFYLITITAKLSYLYEIAFSKVLDKSETALGSYLDITKYTTIDAAGWNKSLVNNLYKYTEYPSNDCAWLTLPVYGAFVGARYATSNNTIGSGHPQAWIECNLGNSNTYSRTGWSNTATNTPTYDEPFLGNGPYFTSATARALGANNTNNKKISFYVTNTTAVKVLGMAASGSPSNAAALNVYECTKNADGTLTASTTAVKKDFSSSTSTSQTFTLTCEGLDATIIYKVEANIYRHYFYEIAFKTEGKLKVDPTEIKDFWQAPGYEHTQSFTVTASPLFGNVEITSNNDYFTVSPSVITPSEFRNNGGKIDVEVTFRPTKSYEVYNAEDYKGNISVKYKNVERGSVAVEGTSRWYPVTVSSAGATTLYYSDPLVIPYDFYPGLLNVLYVKSLESDPDGDSNTTNMKEIYPIIPKETAVVIFANADTYQFPLYNNYKNDVQSIGDNLLRGSLEGTTTQAVINQAKQEGFVDPIVLTLGRQPGSTLLGFYHYVGANLAKNKAYLVYDKGSSSNNVNFISLGGGGSEYTAIQKVENMKEQTEDGAWYTLQGVRLSDKPTQRGIYLHNGKKIMVK